MADFKMVLNADHIIIPELYIFNQKYIFHVYFQVKMFANRLNKNEFYLGTSTIFYNTKSDPFILVLNIIITTLFV